VLNQNLMTEGDQLPLAVHLRDDATLENFLFPQAMLPLREMIAAQLAAAGEAAIYLCGGAGTGRSHLLQAACHHAPAGEALYLPLEQLATMPAAEVLADIENMRLVSLDNLQAVVADSAWEEALFHLINRAQATGCRLLFSADSAPRQLGVQLPDLQSRLSWGVVYQLPELADADKLQILRFRSQRRGIELGEESARYILARAARSLADLMDLLEQLDQASLVAQRPLSIPFIKSTLGW
jgi:DnaA family protein